MAFSGSQITRLRASATPTRKTGSFAGKEAAQAGGESEMIPPWLKKRRIITKII